MYVDIRDGSLYYGDMRPGDRQATSEEEATWLTPTKEQRIAHILATTGKRKDRTLIQQVIQFAEIVAAPLLAAQYGVTLELAIMGLYARNKTYRECKDAETAVEAIEDEP